MHASGCYKWQYLSIHTNQSVDTGIVHGRYPLHGSTCLASPLNKAKSDADSRTKSKGFKCNKCYKGIHQFTVKEEIERRRSLQNEVAGGYISVRVVDSLIAIDCGHRLLPVAENEKKGSTPPLFVIYCLLYCHW